MSSNKVTIYKNFGRPKEPGDYSRLIALTGDRKGDCFYLKDKRIVIGRGEEADIQLLDAKVSREHAEIVLNNNSHVITDLGSHNGVIVNDIKIKQYTLNEDDKIIIGKTVFKFGHVSVQDKADLITSDTEEDEDDSDEDEDEDEDEKSLKKKKDSKAKNKKSKMIIIGVILIGALFLFGDDEETNKKKAKKQDIRGRDSANNALARAIRNSKKKDDKEQKKKLEVIFQRGIREAREGNYFRAINEFNLALILDPENSRARFYISQVDTMIKTTIAQAFKRGSWKTNSLNYQSAINEYCSIVRLLNNRSGKEYKEDLDRAYEQIESLEEVMGLDEGEIKCF